MKQSITTTPAATLLILGVAAGTPLHASTERVTAGTALNPSISVVLDAVYANEFSGHADDPAGFEIGHDHHDHDHDLIDGFNLRETEIVFQSTVDPYFDALVNLAVEGTSGIELEEAYLTTRALPAGLQVKAGRFLSDVGYINQQHPHDWDFVDRPLINEHLFGDEGLQENGVQLSWLAPTRSYLRLGVEVLQGETSGIANYEGAGEHTVLGYADDTGEPDRLRWRADNGLDDVSGPRLGTVFAKWGPDLGFDHAAQFGVSAGSARAFQMVEAHSSGRLETWDGDSWFAGIDAVYKYDPGGYMGHRQWIVQGEYFVRNIDATYRSQTFQDVDTLNVDDRISGTAKQDGIYLQTVYGIAPRWRAGLRAEAIGLTNDTLEADLDNGRFESMDTSYRYSANVTFHPSDFSFIRAQFNYSDFAEEDNDDEGHGAWRFMLQYNLSLGAHGAHPF